MEIVESIHFGKYELRVVKTKGGFMGAVISDGKRSAPIEGDNVDDLIMRLKSEASRMSKSYFGFDGAKSRFLSLFPNGFEDVEFIKREREYKIAAAEKIAKHLPLDKALQGLVDTKALPSLATNLLSRSEAISWGTILKSEHGSDFVRGAAILASGDTQAGLTLMEQAARSADRPSWPLLSYLPYLWRPEEHMFLKPTVTRDFAERVGHPFALEYSPKFSATVYESLLDLAQSTSVELDTLAPRDNVDIQSFIWIVGEYPESLEDE